jgi:hypothetical protein
MAHIPIGASLSMLLCSLLVLNGGHHSIFLRVYANVLRVWPWRGCRVSYRVDPPLPVFTVSHRITAAPVPAQAGSIPPPPGFAIGVKPGGLASRFSFIARLMHYFKSLIHG